MTVNVFFCTDSPNATELEGAFGVPELCRDPNRLRDRLSGPDQVVLVLHRGSFDLARIQAVVRSEGIDPLGVEIVELDPAGPAAADRLRVAVRGASARAAAFRGSVPEQVKLSLASHLSRRAFLRPPAPQYVGAPMIDPDACVAGDGCRMCVAECPQEAYSHSRGRILFNKESCLPCGRCVTVCPTGAISNPTVEPAALLAQVNAMVETAPDPIGIAFTCSRGWMDITAGWHPVVVPCTAMVPGVWLLAVLLLGAGAARIIPCDESGCSLDQDRLAEDAFRLARAAAMWAGWDAGRLPSACGPIASPMSRVPLRDPFSHHGPIEVYSAMIASNGLVEPLEHPSSGLGVVTVDPESCTMCFQCVQVCPTGALAADGDQGGVRLDFDGRLCPGCGQCMEACPEIARGAIMVRSRVDPAGLQGRVILNQATVQRCEVCDGEIAPEPMLARIAELLGDEFATTSAFLGGRCLDCRGG